MQILQIAAAVALGLFVHPASIGHAIEGRAAATSTARAGAPAHASALTGAAAQRGRSSTRRPDLVGRRFDARVVRIADGDTLEAIPAGETGRIRIRLEGIDAPELGEAFSRDAQRFLRTLVFDQVVQVVGKDLDRYGRLVARVKDDGKDASVELVRAGLACHAYAFDAALAREEARARSQGAGFWAAAEKPRCVQRSSFSAPRRPPA